MRTVKIFLCIMSLNFFSAQFALCEEKKITIGVITALTGQMATIGTAVKNGIELAREKNPELFKNIKFVYEDDQFDGKISLVAYRKLKDSDKASVIFGFGAVQAYVLGPVADRDKTPYINFSFEAAPAVNKTFSIRAMNHTDQYMDTLADSLLKNGHKKFYIVRMESPFYSAMADSFSKKVGTRGVIEEVAAHNPSETDFRTTVSKLKVLENNPVGIFLSPDQLIQFVKQSKELQIERLYFGTDLFETAASISADKTMFEGCLYPDNNVSLAFRQDYLKAYGNEAQLTFAGSGFDMTVLLGEILSTQGEFDLKNLMKSLKEVKNKPGVLGTFSFVSDGNFGMFYKYPMLVKSITHSKGVPIQR